MHKAIFYKVKVEAGNENETSLFDTSDIIEFNTEEYSIKGAIEEDLRRTFGDVVISFSVLDARSLI